MIARSASVLVAAVVLSTATIDVSPAFAISAELARKCRAEALKAYPMTLPGTKTGNAKAEREAYERCIAEHTEAPGGGQPQQPSPRN